MAQLKNCPFCGAEADVFMTDSLVNVGCPECDIRTRFYKLDEVEAAEIAWNRRVSGTEDGWISVVEAAEILGVHRNRVLQLVLRRRPPQPHVRLWRYF